MYIYSIRLKLRILAFYAMVILWLCNGYPMVLTGKWGILVAYDDQVSVKKDLKCSQKRK